MLLSSSTSAFTSFGLSDMSIVELEIVSGQLKRKKYITFLSNINIGRGLSKQHNGPFVISGSSR